jgi:hypothetical protein
MDRGEPSRRDRGEALGGGRPVIQGSFWAPACLMNNAGRSALTSDVAGAVDVAGVESGDLFPCRFAEMGRDHDEAGIGQPSLLGVGAQLRHDPTGIA